MATPRIVEVDSAAYGELRRAAAAGVSSRVLDLANELMSDGDGGTFYEVSTLLANLTRGGAPSLEEEAAAEVDLRILGAGSELELTSAVLRKDKIDLATDLRNAREYGSTGFEDVEAMLAQARKQFGY